MLLGGAEDREAEKHARLKAERQAEYNNFLHAKQTVWQEKGVRVARSFKNKAEVPLPPHLKGEGGYYLPDSNAAYNPIWGKEPQPGVKAERKKQYAADLEAQVRQAAERKKQEKAQSIAETRQLLVQAGEIEPDYPPPHGAGRNGGPSGMDGYRGSGYDGMRGSYDAPPQHGAHPGPPDWRQGGGLPEHAPYPLPRRGSPSPPPHEGPYGGYLPPQQDGYAQNPPGGRPYDGPSPGRSYDGPPGEGYAPPGGGYYGGPPPRGFDPQGSPPPQYGPPGGRRHGPHPGQQPEEHMRQAGMVFGAARGDHQAHAQRDGAVQRKAAYRAELEEQMRMVADRKAREKAAAKAADERQEEEARAAGFHMGFGNARGGGGAPHRDDAGNVISNLNRNISRNKGCDPNAPLAPPRRDYPAEPPRERAGAPPPSSVIAQPSETKPKPLGNFRSDHAYMLPSEMEARARKQREMQDALQEQINAKKRAKEEERRREEEADMRELERLAREQEELKAAFERESEGKKAKAAAEADEMRRLAEEAYVKAKAKQPARRASSAGDRHSRPPSACMDGPAQPPLYMQDDGGPPYPPPEAHAYHGPPGDGRHRPHGPPYPPPPEAHHAAYHGPPPGMRGPPPREDHRYYDAHRPPTGGSGRTATEMARLREEIAAQQAEMKRAVERQMHGLTKQQEREIDDLRRRAEAAEAEMAEMRRSFYQQQAPFPSGPPYGRRASAGRRQWGDESSGGGFDMELPQHVPTVAAPASAAGYAASLQLQQLRDSGDSVDLDASLAGDSRLIFPGGPPSRGGPAPGGSIRDLSISSLKPLPSKPAAAPQKPGAGAPPGRASGVARPRSRLGTPVDVDGVLAKAQDRTRMLDVLQENAAAGRGANSDALDDLLIKFVELEQAGEAAVNKSDMSMSMAGDSEWIR